MAKESKDQTELTGKEIRKAAHDSKVAEMAMIEDSREEFRKYFVGLKRQLNLGPELEHVIWLHLKAVGMAKKEQFGEGIRHFGYKI